jgi:hypothetical protein
MQPARKAITVRVRVDQMRKVMRSRKPNTQSGVINALIAEAAERIDALAALTTVAGTFGPDDFDDRLM